jgi:triacylglycerol lipase
LSVGIGGYDPLALPPLATVHYWRGIKEALEQSGCERVIITRVPRTASIENRAEILRKEIATKCKPGDVLNLIAHSMVTSQFAAILMGQGGLDARYMLSIIKPTEFRVGSLTTIATPHRFVFPLKVLTIGDQLLQITFFRTSFLRIL